jgi:hypothetical protein
MQTIVIELINKKAMQILRDLEELKLIRLHQGKSKEADKSIKPSQLRGSISKKTTKQLLEHIEQSRSEWV